MRSARRFFLFLMSFMFASCSMISAGKNTRLTNGRPLSMAATPTECGCSNTSIGVVTPTSGLVAAGPAGPGQASAPSNLEAYRDRWTTYTNAKYGFSFAYPAVYTSKEYGACAAREGESIPPGALFSASLGERTTLALYQTGQTLPAVVGAFQADPTHKDFRFDAPRERTVGGVPALTLGYRSGGTNRFAESTFFIKDGMLYRIDTGISSACDVPLLNLRELDAYSHMLDTFQFGK